MTRENPVVAFARDFSESDPSIMAKVAEFVADPPKDDETIGFCGTDDAPPQARLFLSTVNLLDNSGKLHSVEDKYTNEILWHWRDIGALDPATLPPASSVVFTPILNGSFEMPNDQRLNAYREFVWHNYAKATEELEQHMAARGKMLLSIDATDGDTMFFALASPQIAERWRDTALSEHDGYRSGVRSPMWDVFWSRLTYAVRVPDGSPLVTERQDGFPRGTRLRNNDIPFAR